MKQGWERQVKRASWPALLAGVVIVSAIYGGIVWAVWAGWDAIAVDVFGAPSLTYWQTCGALLVLALIGRVMGMGQGGGKS